MNVNSRVSVGMAICGLSLAASSGFAHHSFSSIFDPAQPFEFVGTVTKVELRNPHALLYMDVEDEDGNVTNWSMELLSANQLVRQGWNRDTVKPGDVVTVTGQAARDGSSTGGASSVTLNSTGETIYEGNFGGE